MPDPRYLAIRAELKTGDLLLFSGSSGTSDLIKRFTLSHWSHIGMILEVPGLHGPLVLESLRIGAHPDVHTGEVRSGVQLLDLTERVRHCTDPIAVRRLSHPVTPEMHAAALAFYEEVRGRSYEQSLAELVRAAWDGWGGANEEDLSSLFCSELVAEAYQRMGLLTCDTRGGLASNEYVPAEFGVLTELLGGWSLRPEHLIVG